jgi:hypothetical protein
MSSQVQPKDARAIVFAVEPDRSCSRTKPAVPTPGRGGSRPSSRYVRGASTVREICG